MKFRVQRKERQIEDILHRALRMPLGEVGVQAVMLCRWHTGLPDPITAWYFGNCISILNSACKSPRENRLRMKTVISWLIEEQQEGARKSKPRSGTKVTVLESSCLPVRLSTGDWERIHFFPFRLKYLWACLAWLQSCV